MREYGRRSERSGLGDEHGSPQATVSLNTDVQKAATVSHERGGKTTTNFKDGEASHARALARVRLSSTSWLRDGQVPIRACRWACNVMEAILTHVHPALARPASAAKGFRKGFVRRSIHRTEGSLSFSKRLMLGIVCILRRVEKDINSLDVTRHVWWRNAELVAVGRTKISNMFGNI